MNIKDLPVWESCPFRDHIPSRYAILKDTGDVFHLYDPIGDIHVSLANSAPAKVDLDPLLHNLTGAILYKEFGARFTGLPIRQARHLVATGEPVPPEDKDIWVKMKELQSSFYTSPMFEYV